VKEWFIIHWVEILTFLGIGTGGTLGITKAIDRKQNGKIAFLIKENKDRKAEIESMIFLIKENSDRKNEITEMGFSILLNNKMDEQLRRELNEYKSDLNRIFDKIDTDFNRRFSKIDTDLDRLYKLIDDKK